MHFVPHSQPRNARRSEKGIESHKPSSSPNIAGIDPFGDPDTAIQLFHPRKDHWASHFKWTGPELVGVTPDGRVTIAVLRINEPDAIAFRELLLDSGFVL